MILNSIKNVLTIAGSDCSGGAGIQADLKTFSANGVYGMSVVTSVTSQNSLGVKMIENVSEDIVSSQMHSLFSDIRIDAIKIGMIPNEAIANEISRTLKNWKNELESGTKEELNTSEFPEIVLDPVMISSSGKQLMTDDAKKIVVEEMFPLCSLITPNIPEAESLTGIIINSEETLKKAADELIKMGPKYVLIKGGHLKAGVVGTDYDRSIAETQHGRVNYENVNKNVNNRYHKSYNDSYTDIYEPKDRTDLSRYCVDILFDGVKFTEYITERIEGVSPHGTGCTLSSAIAANLANEMSMEESIKRAKDYITICIKNSIKVGQGEYYLNHFANL